MVSSQWKKPKCSPAAVHRASWRLSPLGNGWICAILVLSVIIFEVAAQPLENSSPSFDSPVSAPEIEPEGWGMPIMSKPPASAPVDTPDSAEQKLVASKVPLNIAFAGLALYSLIGLLTLVAMIFPPQRVTPTRQLQIVQRLFSVLVIVFCLIRLVYFCFPIAHVSVTVTYIVNQVAFMVFFTMFSLIIFFWAEQYHRKFYDTQSMLPRLRNVFIAVNAVLWLTEIILVTLACVLDQVPKDKLTQDPTPPPVVESPSLSPIVTFSMAETTTSPSTPSTPMLTPSTNTKGAGLGGPVYFASVILVIVVDFIFALGFAIYGVMIFVQKYTHALGSGLRRELISTMVVTIVFGCCFALRMIMFLYRPITGKFMNPILYRVLAYFVPEVVAVLLQVSVVYLMNHTAGGSGGWKRGARGAGSIQRPSVEDDIYYAADQDLRASAMPAPLANAHQRLISPPRPLRANFSSSVTTASSSINTSNSAPNNSLPAATGPPSTGSHTSSSNSNRNNSIQNGSGITSDTASHSGANKTPIGSPPHAAGAAAHLNPLRSGLPVVIATHQHTRIGSPLHNVSTSPRSFTPASFSPGHDHQLLLSTRPEPVLPLQNLDTDPGSGRYDGASDDSEASIEIDPTDTDSLLTPTRKAPKRY